MKIEKKNKTIIRHAKMFQGVVVTDWSVLAENELS